MSTIHEAVYARHSVRSYLNKPLDAQLIQTLNTEIKNINQQTGLHIQLVTNEPAAFSGSMAHYGNFKGVSNYLALIGPKGPQLEEQCGYWGEHLVLLAQQLGLNTCWVAVTFKKVPSAYKLNTGEKLVLVIALGYGDTQGVSHRSKNYDDVTDAGSASPDWFKKGVEYALLAPTAINQQKFRITLQGDTAAIRPLFGPFSKVDLGIVKYHFELGSGRPLSK